MDDTTKNIIRVIDFVIGTEEDVNNRRELALIGDKLLSTRHNKRITSGSFAEGVYSVNSDIDFMQEKSMLIACLLSDTLPTDRCICFYMIPSPENHCYCMLLCQNRHLLSDDYIEFYEGGYYLSGGKIKHYFCNQNQSSDIHGPCVQSTTGDFEIEYALCIRCMSWPDVANEWISRPRSHGWPSTPLIRKIIEGSCQVVPVGVPNSPTNSLEWRISFSVAERALVHAFNRTQFIIYCLLKRITKEIIEQELPNVMCSYFIKTVLFYSIESTRKSMWGMQNLQECLHKCIRILYRFVDDLYCPHYFIRDVNLFKFKVNSQNQSTLLSVLRHLLSLNLQHILSGLNGFSSFINIDTVLPISSPIIEMSSVIKYTIDIALFTLWAQEELSDKYDYFMRVFNVLQKCCSLPSNTVIHIRAALYTILADFIYNSHSTTGNITQYRVDKLIKHFYKLGTLLDVTFGRLRLASFYLMKGNISNCLNVIQSVLNRFSPCVRTVGAELTPSYCDYYSQIMCGRGLSTVQKFQSSVAMCSIYSSIDINVPLAIHYQILDNTMTNIELLPTHISPLTHAYFLQALCYIEQNDQYKLGITVQMMKEIITNVTTVYKASRHNDYNIFGYIIMKQGNIRDAVQYHVKSFYSKVKLQTKYRHQYKYNIAVLRIMCCLRLCLHPSQAENH